MRSTTISTNREWQWCFFSVMHYFGFWFFCACSAPQVKWINLLRESVNTNWNAPGILHWCINLACNAVERRHRIAILHDLIQCEQAFHVRTIRTCNLFVRAVKMLRSREKNERVETKRRKRRNGNKLSKQSTDHDSAWTVFLKFHTTATRNSRRWLFSFGCCSGCCEETEQIHFVLLVECLCMCSTTDSGCRWTKTVEDSKRNGCSRQTSLGVKSSSGKYWAYSKCCLLFASVCRQ